MTAFPEQIPAEQLGGFLDWQPHYALIATSETTASTTYVDLATVGPTLTGLPDGTYIVAVGGHLSNSGVGATIMSFSVNGAAATDTEASRMAGTNIVTPLQLTQVTLSSGDNTLTAKYRVVSGTGTYVDRWIVAIKSANP